MSALYRRRPEVVEALRVDFNTTSDQIKALDPKANVGMCDTRPGPQWVVLSNGQSIGAWGDWITKSPTGRLRTFTATQFALDYDVIL